MLLNNIINFGQTKVVLSERLTLQARYLQRTKQTVYTLHYKEFVYVKAHLLHIHIRM